MPKSFHSHESTVQERIKYNTDKALEEIKENVCDDKRDIASIEDVDKPATNINHLVPGEVHVSETSTELKPSTGNGSQVAAVQGPKLSLPDDWDTETLTAEPADLTPVEKLKWRVLQHAKKPEKVPIEDNKDKIITGNLSSLASKPGERA